MTRRSIPGRRTALAIALLAAGATLVLFGVLDWLPRREPSLLASPVRHTRTATASTVVQSTAAPWRPSATTWSSPAATEPLLPPPPTATATTRSHPTPTSAPSATAGLTRISPTKAPPPTSSVPPSAPSPDSTSTSGSTGSIDQGLYGLRQRLGVGGTGPSPVPDEARALGFGWYLDWSANPDAHRSPTVEYVPMIRLRGGTPQPSGDELLAAVDALLGALWLIGNEPDVMWQDNVAPDLYARLYHDLYVTLKQRDPTCRVAIGGVSQPTPLRLRYLDLILQAYEQAYGEPMPVDVWNVHAFILREERGSWGVDIPPGLSDQAGELREITDHDDLDLFRQQILDFRQWMADHGQQHKELIVSEYGILMPADYGFPPARVESFLRATFGYFRTAADPALGLAADGYRLVQKWSWFSVADDLYPTGDLVQPTGALTPLGAAFAGYAAGHQAEP